MYTGIPYTQEYHIHRNTIYTGIPHTQEYHMIHMGYGAKFDGYMGCAIAFPTDKYSLATCKIERVADLKHWPRLPRHCF
jgi:hypothetical protein